MEGDGGVFSLEETLFCTSLQSENDLPTLESSIQNHDLLAFRH